MLRSDYAPKKTQRVPRLTRARERGVWAWADASFPPPRACAQDPKKGAHRRARRAHVCACVPSSLALQAPKLQGPPARPKNAMRYAHTSVLGVLHFGTLASLGRVWIWILEDDVSHRYLHCLLSMSSAVPAFHGGTHAG